MELLSVLSLCLLTCSTPTSAQQSGPAASRLVVKEDDNALLPCFLGSSDITEQVFNWKNDRKAVFFYNNGSSYNNVLVGQDPQFKNRVDLDLDKLASGNASITLKKAEVRDSGSYTCDFPSSQPARRAHVELIVGASREPIISLNKTNDGILLRCKVGESFPQPRVEWWDAAGNILPAEEPQVTKRQDRYHVVLQTTVRESGFYRCVATQDQIHSQVYADTYVPVPVPDSSTLLILAVVFGTLFVGVLLLLAVLFHKGLLKCNKGSERSSSAPVAESSNDAALPFNGHSWS